MVGVGCHDVSKVQGRQEEMADRTQFRERVSDLKIRPSEFVMQGPLQLAFDGRRVIQLQSTRLWLCPGSSCMGHRESIAEM